MTFLTVSTQNSAYQLLILDFYFMRCVPMTAQQEEKKNSGDEDDDEPEESSNRVRESRGTQVR